MMDDLKTIQVSLETEALAKGLRKSEESIETLRKEGDVLAHNPYKKLTKGSLPLVTEVIRSDQGAWASAKAGRKPIHVGPLSSLDPEVIAYAGLFGSFQGLARALDYRACAIEIGALLEDEVRFQVLKEADATNAQRVQQRATARKDLQGRRKALRAMMGKLDKGEWVRWDQNTKLRIGGYVLNKVLEHSQVFTLYGDRRIITVTEEAQGFLQDLESRPPWFHPIILPVVTPPTRWTGLHTGGYLTKDLQRRFPMVRTLDPQANEAVTEAFKDGSMAPTVESLNRIQETPFSINERVLEMVQWAYEQDTILNTFPRQGLLPLPPVPEGYDELPDEEQLAWRRKRSEVHSVNRGILGEQAQFASDMITANRMNGFERFYLPHNLDFRGRVYPIPPFNHQRADHIKALFNFARGYRLGEDGGYWLAIHLANCGDFQKVSKAGFGDRVQWVLDHREDILAVAEDPYTNLLWAKADKPFSFLAACFEWAGYEAEGEDFVSYLPVSFDGSNSGIQHYSAALRSSRDGQHVNLVPQDKPADMYSEVAQKVLQKVEEDAEGGDEIAQLWLTYGVTRSVVKRPTMTFAYSAEAYGYKQQLLTDLMEPLAREVQYGQRDEHPFGDHRTQFTAAGYLAKAIYAAVVATVSDAHGAMKWFQKVAGALAHESKPVTWTTPMGFPVVHRYIEWEVYRADLTVYDRKIEVVYPEEEEPSAKKDFSTVKINIRTHPTQRIVKSKQRSAIAPNVIHSMDAAHLLKAVDMAFTNHGIQDFFLIHDSFGCPAGQAEQWFEVVRQSFIKLYEDYDVFKVLDHNARETLTEAGKSRLPEELPSKGDLEMTSVQESLYAFA